MGKKLDEAVKKYSSKYGFFEFSRCADTSFREGFALAQELMRSEAAEIHDLKTRYGCSAKDWADWLDE